MEKTETEKKTSTRIASAIARPTRASLEKLRVQELREELKRRNLSHFGKKAELVARLHEALTGEKQTPSTSPQPTQNPVSSVGSSPQVQQIHPMQGIGFVHRVPMQFAGRYQMFTQSMPGMAPFQFASGVQALNPPLLHVSQQPIQPKTEEVRPLTVAQSTSTTQTSGPPDKGQAPTQQLLEDRSPAKVDQEPTLSNLENLGIPERSEPNITVELPAHLAIQPSLRPGCSEKLTEEASQTSDEIRPYPLDIGDPSKPPDQQPPITLNPTVDTYEINNTGIMEPAGKDEKLPEPEEPVRDHKRKSEDREIKMDTELSAVPTKRFYSEERR